MSKIYSDHRIRCRLQAFANIGCALIFLLVSVGSLCASNRSLAMWSWRGEDGIWNFVILPDRLEPPYWSEAEILRGSTIKGAKAMREYIDSLPARTNICWRNLPPSKVIVFPPKSISQPILRAAKERSVNLEIWPTLVE